MRARRPVVGAFWCLVLLELAILAGLSVSHRLVTRHDGFQYFSLQYYFLNNVTQTHEVPLWMPFMTQGTVSTWWYTIQASLVQSVLLCTGGLLRAVNFLPIFYFQIFVDHLVLLVGTWLLAGRFTSSGLGRLFTAVIVLGSCWWWDQPWFNFHIYYALPLILHFGHRFFETARWRHLFLAGNLAALQLLGNLPYGLPPIMLFIFLYFAVHAALNRAEYARALREALRAWPWGVAAGGGVALTFLACYLAVTHGTENIANYNVLRNRDGTAPLDTFLYYGNTGRLRWLELLTGFQVDLDFNLFSGFLSIPFAALAFRASRRRSAAHLGVLTALWLAISLATPVATAAYYAWPMMKYYRHLTLLSPYAHLLICFLAGIGFGAVVEGEERISKGLLSWTLLLAALSAALFWGSRHGAELFDLFREAYEGLPPIYTLKSEWLEQQLARASLWALLATGALAFSAWAFSSRGSPRLRHAALVALVAVVGTELYSGKIWNMLDRSVPLLDEQMQELRFQPMPYQSRRSRDYGANPRASSFLSALRYGEHYGEFYGATYWSNESFFFMDSPDSVFRVDHWLIPLDRLVRASQHKALDNRNLPPPGSGYKKFKFPRLPALDRAAGLTDDKLRVYDGAASTELSLEGSGRESHRLHPALKVTGFGANQLSLEIGAVPAGAWLFYSDVWDPGWRATVNGHSAEVRVADLAYKAVPLDAGANTVELTYHDPLRTALYLLFALNSAAWLLGVGALALKTRTQRARSGSPA